MKRRAVYFAEPGRVEVCEETLDAPGPGQVLVESEVSAISAGTEMLFYRGQVPRDMPVDASIAGLTGSVRYPLKYGYALAGHVRALGSGVDAAWLGRAVFAFHPHESHFLAAPGELIPLPGGLAPEDAACLPNMETAVNLVMDGTPLIGERIVVFGQGVVGLLVTALLARMSPARLIGVDAFALRREQSLRMGAHAALDRGDAAGLRAALGRDDVDGADLCYELSGRPEALDDAIAATGFAGRVVVGSWYGEKRATLGLGGRFHRSRIRLIASQVSTIAPEWSGRWSTARRLQLALDLLAGVKPARLVTQRVPAAQAAQAYDLIDRHAGETVQVLLDYRQG